MTVAVRFAPSPTGLLHIGNLRAALTNWLFARKEGGTFLYRLDDTDEERSRPEYAEAIEEDLRWLGLTWDRFARESDRYGRYAEAVEALKKAGRLYPCYETAEELGLKRKALLAQHRPPLYDRAALKLTDADRARLEAEGRKPHWRFKLEHADIGWDDLIQGKKHFHGRDLSDPVLLREDGRPLYTLTSVVDDLDLDITHIIRGEDHVTNTAVQIQLFEALMAAEGRGAVPTFAHFPLIADSGGQGLSKRLGSLSLRSLREEEGIEPLALLSYMAALGTSDAIVARASHEELVAHFDLSHMGRGTPKFDPDELLRLNAQVLHALPFDAVRNRLAALGMAADEAFWLAVRPNLGKLTDARDWWEVTHDPVVPLVDDAGFLAKAAELLPPEPWGPETWGQWTEAVKAATGAKGKALFLPLRRALTARDHGPELKTLLPLVGRERALARLSGQTA
ncbi:glutamate--tRNA ligase [Aerophototrophica crusticola]|uniref:Glutamate--tRNA ligase n=1 Tax=Aerophototrophica crusticola TaxID=1709002 RepID=A0A858R6B1_9PROT|nr:glutamate--tRNA ligase [Rhodospirillaceae bacterium B3]